MIIPDWIKILIIIPTISANIFLALLVFYKNPKATINRIFFLIGFLFGVWGFCLLLYEFPLMLTSRFWIEATYVSVSILEVIILIFSFIFPKPIFKRARVWAAFYGLFFIILTIYLLYFTNYWVIDVIRDPKRGLQTILGGGYLVWTIAIWGVIGWSIINLIANIKHSTSTQRIQLKYFIFGFFLYGISSTILDVVIPFAWMDTGLFSISVAGSLFFSLATTYVILKHRFLDIQLITSRIVAYILLILTVAAIYSMLVPLLSTFILSRALPVQFAIFPTIITFIGIFIFNPLRMFYENATSSFLYKDQYNIGEVLSNLSKVMAVTLEPQDLTSQISTILQEKVRVSRVIFVRIHEKDISLMYVFPQGSQPKFNENDVALVLGMKKILIREEMEEGSIRKILDEWDVSIALPLINGENVIGLILLGSKSTGNIYFAKDIQMFEVVSSELAIAFENTLRFEQVKEFNITLEKEVSKQTRELREANKHLMELDKLKDNFISVTSHELRTPLTIIRGNLWLILNKYKNLESEITERVRDSMQSSEHLISLVSDILDLSAIEGGKINLNISKTNVSDILIEIEEGFNEIASKNGIKFINKFTDEKYDLLTDPERLGTILKNLITNAINSIEKSGEITVVIEKKNSNISVSISDNGIGIKGEDIPKLFTKFGRLETSLNANTKGVGLGLYIVKKLMDSLRGEIRVDSVYGKGSTFTLTLPIVEEKM